MKKRIKCFEVSDEIFDQRLYDFQEFVEIKDNLDRYLVGYDDKKKIYYDGKEYLICREYILNYYCNNIEFCTDWKQCRIRRVENADTEVSSTVSGQYAWNYMIGLLEKYYRWSEIVEIFNKYSIEYDINYKQYHYYYPLEVNELEKISDCYVYDINGAHNDALVEMFPKAKKHLLMLYEHRHENVHYKEFVNYFVGMLKRKGYPNTYNWIVQRTTKRLFEAMDKTQGVMVYANTDGYVISAPTIKLDTSMTLGDFKLEYAGDVYVYQDVNYWIMQIGDKFKGSALKSIRKDLSLENGEVVHYTRTREKIGESMGKPYYINVATNITKETIKNGKRKSSKKNLLK